MVELIASILFIGSAAGAITFAAKKMPAADQLPEKARELRLASVFGVINNWMVVKIKKTKYFKDFSWIDFVQKRLLKTRVIVMKAENKINDYMVKLRQRAEDQKNKDEALLDNYWHDLKTMVKTKKPLVVKGVQSLETGASELAQTISVKIGGAISGEKPVSVQKSVSNIEPMIGRVVMPEDVIQKPAHQQKKRHSSNSKKQRFRDPFRW